MTLVTSFSPTPRVPFAYPRPLTTLLRNFLCTATDLIRLIRFLRIFRSLSGIPLKRFCRFYRISPTLHPTLITLITPFTHSSREPKHPFLAYLAYFAFFRRQENLKTRRLARARRDFPARLIMAAPGSGGAYEPDAGCGFMQWFRVLLVFCLLPPLISTAQQPGSPTAHRRLVTPSTPLKALDGAIAYETGKPGRKVIVWISPGWPTLARATSDISRTDQRQVFNTIVNASKIGRAHV